MHLAHERCVAEADESSVVVHGNERRELWVLGRRHVQAARHAEGAADARTHVHVAAHDEVDERGARMRKLVPERRLGERA